MRQKLAAVLVTNFLLLAAMLAAQPSAAADDSGKATVYVSQSATLGSGKLDPGNYDVKADRANVTFALNSNGKVVAQAKIEWKDDSAKASSSTLEYNSGKVVAIHFKGKSRFASISE